MLQSQLDLAFQPVTNASPKALSLKQIEQYNREGYVSGFIAFDENGSNANRAYFDDLLTQAGPDAAYGINCFQARLAGLWDICTNATILDHVQDIVGPNIICWAAHFFAKLPGDPKTVPWHQDASFWHFSPARTVTVWLAIDDTDEENAAMRFIPGTHDKGPMQWGTAAKESVLDRELIGAEDLGAPVSNDLRAGQFSMHADMLAHGSLPNTSSRRRCGLTIRYCPPEVAVTNEAWGQGIEAILCRGEDRTGAWRHHSRPQSDRLVLSEGPRNIGGN